MSHGSKLGLGAFSLLHDSPNPCQQCLTRAEEARALGSRPLLLWVEWSAEGRANSLPPQGVWGSNRVPPGRLGAGRAGAGRSAAPPPYRLGAN